MRVTLSAGSVFANANTFPQSQDPYRITVARDRRDVTPLFPLCSSVRSVVKS